SRGCRFVIKLTRLREIRLFTIEVIDLKERRRAFTSRGREDRRIHEREAVVVEKIPHRLNNRVTNLQHRMLASRTQPQVPVVHQKLRPVLFRSDRVIVDLLQYFSIGDVDLVTTGRATVSANSAFDHQRRLLAESLQLFPQLRRDPGLQNDTLNHTRAVAQLRKGDLAARAQVIKPSFKDYFSTDVV